MTGSARMKANSSATPIVVVNGSPIPSVTGLLPSGAFERRLDRLAQLRGHALKRRAGLSRRAAARDARARRPRAAAALRPCARSADGVGGAERAVACPHLFLGLVGERLVDDVKQRVVLPHAEAKRHGERRQRDDQPRAQLLKVIDDADAIFIPDAPDGDGHEHARPAGL